jgi:hypothetical protein
MRTKSAARITKQLAAKQKIRIDLTEEQLKAITDQWKVKSPNAPAEISFHVGERKAASLKVASYSYWGDTCCV